MCVGGVCGEGVRGTGVGWWRIVHPPGPESSGTNNIQIAKVVSLPLLWGYDNEAGFTFSSHHNIRVLPHKRFVLFRDRDNL